MALASSVMDEAAALCGDRNKVLYNYEKLLPLLRRATRDLSLALIAAGETAVITEQVSNTIAAAVVEHPNPPNDLGVPIEMWERPDASTSVEDWTPMTEKVWDPSEPQMESLEVWKFENEKILFRGATTARKVRLRYRKALAAITDQNSTIAIFDCENYLASKTASYAARFVGKNVALGQELNGDAQLALDLLLGIRTREDQNEILRMLPYSMRRDG